MPTKQVKSTKFMKWNISISIRWFKKEFTGSEMIVDGIFRFNIDCHNADQCHGWYWTFILHTSWQVRDLRMGKKREEKKRSRICLSIRMHSMNYIVKISYTLLIQSTVSIRLLHKWVNVWMCATEWKQLHKTDKWNVNKWIDLLSTKALIIVIFYKPLKPFTDSFVSVLFLFLPLLYCNIFSSAVIESWLVVRCKLYMCMWNG